MLLTENDLKALNLLKRYGKLRYSDLQAHLGISPGGLTKLLNKLTSQNLIKREVNPDRSVYYSLTKEGEKVVRNELLNTLELYSHVLDEEDRKEVEALIQKLKEKYGV